MCLITAKRFVYRDVGDHSRSTFMPKMPAAKMRGRKIN
jgi:hypothetical protein